MMEVTSHAPGTFCWAELSTSDGSAAKQFYTQLFGWVGDDHDMGENGVYTMLNLRGKPAAALYQEREQHGPPHWGTYVAVESADAASEKAKSLGAAVLAGPFDVSEHGRMAVIQEPEGAVFSVWEPRAHIGAQVVGEPGAVCWNELGTRDPERSKRFYTSLFGWAAKQHGPDFGNYVEFQNGGQSFAGMMALSEEQAGVPPHWLVYFASADCDATAARAAELGGSAIVPPTDIPGVGRFAVLRDPQGAVFATLQWVAQGS